LSEKSTANLVVPRFGLMLVQTD